ncbi:flavodoxin-dependent (E)-4-hydroxy-3-methylbut-2-enyl-diphosphate synthase [Candidatus Peregrinibacteria bacterium]|nr:flavodoxin-dependent (E)-4-hydroxy-3-methylbut-2-enyl-diphosphate synthase [Candidatus Peregrinibacteria bacterium]
MPDKNPNTIQRRKTLKIIVGKPKKREIIIGGLYPVVIQSMCTTKTEDWKATAEQIITLKKEKCQMVRVAVPSLEAAKSIPKIRKHIKIPLVADIHFDYRLALEAIKQDADKIRINPGNIGEKDKVREIILAAKKAKIPLRLGVNGGCLENDILKKYGHSCAAAMNESARRWIRFFEKQGFKNFVVSLKASSVIETVKACRLFSKDFVYPLHLGVTEAGLNLSGIVKSSAGIGSLLLDGIGDTIRVSISGDAVKEVIVAKEILKALGMYNLEPEIIACPTCGRTEIDLEKIASEIEQKTKYIQKPIKIAVMGCVVNGPGEARGADYAVCGGKKMGAIYKNGQLVKSVKEDKLVSEFMKIINKDY